MNAAQRASTSDSDTLREKLQRVLFREFIGEPKLYEEVGLEQLPSSVGKLLGCSPEEGLLRLAASTFLEDLDMPTLKRLFQIRDMDLVSRTTAAVSAELKDPDVSYETAIRRSLSYGVTDLKAHAFAALRAAAQKRPDWARHHYLYGLLQGLAGDFPRALRSLNKALELEPYEDARQRVRATMGIIEGPRVGPPLHR